MVEVIKFLITPKLVEIGSATSGDSAFHIEIDENSNDWRKASVQGVGKTNLCSLSTAAATGLTGMHH